MRRFPAFLATQLLNMQLIIACIAIVLLVSPLKTKAATIDFTFTNPSVPDTVTGEIEGLTVGATSSASAVYITGYTEPSSGSPFSFPTPLLINSSVTSNSFTLDALGNLLAASFTGNGIFDLNGSYVALSLNMSVSGDFDVGGVFQDFCCQYGPHSGGYVQTGGDFGQLEYQSVADAVPEPSTWALMLLGFCGLSLIARRRNRAGAGLGEADYPPDQRHTHGLQTSPTS